MHSAARAPPQHRPQHSSRRSSRHHPAAGPLLPQRCGRHGTAAPHAVGRTAFSFETQRLARTLVTRQAIKTVLNYLSETNGEMHFFLHNWVSENPLPLGGDADPDAWLVALAAAPLTRVHDPRRSSVPSAAAAAAVVAGSREVSPRDVAERIMGVREHISQEVAEDMRLVREANAEVQRRALQKSLGL